MKTLSLSFNRPPLPRIPFESHHQLFPSVENSRGALIQFDEVWCALWDKKNRKRMSYLVSKGSFRVFLNQVKNMQMISMSMRSNVD